MTPLLVALPLALLLAPAQATEGPAYRVGPGDVLEVAVEGRPDLSRLPTVQTTGTVFLPRVGELEVRGLTTDEIAARLAARLADEALPAPHVVVRVRDYQSQFVWVRGAVNRPGRKPLRSGTRLVDALLDAGGLAAGASGEIVVERAGGFADGSREQRFRFAFATATPEALQQLALPLAPDDVVSASLQQWVLVSGAVRRPGRYPLDRAPTPSRAVASAGGLLPGGRRRVVVRRKDAAGGGREVEADLDAIRSGKAQELELRAGDEVAVKASRP